MTTQPLTDMFTNVISAVQNIGASVPDISTWLVFFGALWWAWTVAYK